MLFQENLVDVVTGECVRPHDPRLLATPWLALGLGHGGSGLDVLLGRALTGGIREIGLLGFGFGLTDAAVRLQ